MPPQYPSLNNQILTERERVPSGAPKRFLTVSFLLFLLTFLVYLGLAFGYSSYLRGEIDDREAKLKDLARQISAEDQKELVRLYSQINNTERLLASHVLTSRVFSFLENNTARQVTYIGVDLSVLDRRLVVDGAAASYDELIKQLTAYERATEVERMNLESSEASGGVVRFKVSLTLKPEVFKP